MVEARNEDFFYGLARAGGRCLDNECLLVEQTVLEALPDKIREKICVTMARNMKSHCRRCYDTPSIGVRHDGRVFAGCIYRPSPGEEPLCFLGSIHRAPMHRILARRWELPLWHAVKEISFERLRAKFMSGSDRALSRCEQHRIWLERWFSRVGARPAAPPWMDEWQ